MPRKVQWDEVSYENEEFKNDSGLEDDKMESLEEDEEDLIDDDWDSDIMPSIPNEGASEDEDEDISDEYGATEAWGRGSKQKYGQDDYVDAEDEHEALQLKKELLEEARRIHALRLKTLQYSHFVEFETRENRNASLGERLEQLAANEVPILQSISKRTKKSAMMKSGALWNDSDSEGEDSDSDYEHDKELISKGIVRSNPFKQRKAGQVMHIDGDESGVDNLALLHELEKQIDKPRQPKENSTRAEAEGETEEQKMARLTAELLAEEGEGDFDDGDNDGDNEIMDDMIDESLLNSIGERRSGIESNEFEPRNTTNTTKSWTTASNSNIRSFIPPLLKSPSSKASGTFMGDFGTGSSLAARDAARGAGAGAGGERTSHQQSRQLSHMLNVIDQQSKNAKKNARSGDDDLGYKELREKKLTPPSGGGWSGESDEDAQMETAKEEGEKISKKVVKSVKYPRLNKSGKRGRKELDNGEVKRSANRRIVKNLPTVYRKKRESSRVKNRGKFEKALKRRRGQVKNVVEDRGAVYGGEMSGIRRHVVHSRSLSRES